MWRLTGIPASASNASSCPDGKSGLPATVPTRTRAWAPPSGRGRPLRRFFYHEGYPEPSRSILHQKELICLNESAAVELTAELEDDGAVSDSEVSRQPSTAATVAT